MKSVVILLCGICCAAGSAELAHIQSVYLLPMGGGLEQFLANRLTAGRVVQVVSDPRKADAVFTDRLGEDFENRLNELYPPQAPKPAAGPESTGGKGDDANIDQGKRVRALSFGRGRGAVFLVDVKTRAVLWSTFEQPGDSAPAQMDRRAARIADRLKRELKSR